MGMKTGKIVYNVTERGRKFRGNDRNFDTVRLAEMINGGAVQERVKHRDMLGFYGHWPRVRFGMNPMEGGIADGKAVPLEPAIVTTFLKANSDGTIEHESEFLDTAAGRLAERLFKSKTGGFSSAISMKNVGSKQMPTEFHGFDFVFEPNFTTNRGYELALDRVNDDASLCALDDVAQYAGLLDSTNKILDAMQSEFDRMAEATVSLQRENEELIAMCAKATGKKPEIVLDGIREVIMGSRTSRFDKAEDFHAEKLIGFEQPKQEKSEGEAQADRHIHRRFGV